MIWRRIIWKKNYPPPDHNLGQILNSDPARSYFPLKILNDFRCGNNGLKATTWTCSFAPGVTASDIAINNDSGSDTDNDTASQQVHTLTSNRLLLLAPTPMTDPWIVRSQLSSNEFDISAAHHQAGLGCYYLVSYVDFANYLSNWASMPYHSWLMILCQPSSFLAKNLCIGFSALLLEMLPWNRMVRPIYATFVMISSKQFSIILRTWVFLPSWVDRHIIFAPHLVDDKWSNNARIS